MKSLLRLALLLRCWLLAAIERDPERPQPRAFLRKLRAQQKPRSARAPQAKATKPRQLLQMGFDMTCVHPCDGPPPADTPPIILNDH